MFSLFPIGGPTTKGNTDEELDWNKNGLKRVATGKQAIEFQTLIGAQSGGCGG